MTRVYLDVCCLNRPFDDQTQARIHLEAEAVLMIVARCEAGQWEWASSDVVDVEIERTPDPERRRRVRALVSHAHCRIAVGQSHAQRAQQIASLGISAYDALHLACAESGEIDVLLTTDDQLLRRSKGMQEQLRIRVENPLVWLGEVS